MEIMNYAVLHLYYPHWRYLKVIVGYVLSMMSRVENEQELDEIIKDKCGVSYKGSMDFLIMCLFEWL